jgi:hypothetical protein
MRRHTEVALNGSRLYRHFANSLLIAGSLLLLTLSASGREIMRGRLAANPSPVAFGNTQAGTTANLTVALWNYGGTDVTITRATMNGAGFWINNLALPLTLRAGAATSATITFAPGGSGVFSGSVLFDTVAQDGVANRIGLTLSGNGVNSELLTPKPSSLAFGNVQVGGSSNLSETLINAGASTITISQANLTGAEFSISGLNLPLTLTANQSVTFTATFSPTGSGSASGNLSVVASAPNSPVNIALSGSGAASGQLAVTPASLSFGNVAVGSSSSLNGSLNASGASVTITSASLNNGEFVLSGISLPTTLAAGQSTPFTITFTPQASGATSASLSFSSNAANSPAVQSMTGTGTAAAQHIVDLSWNPSSDVAGYNVYRSTVAGGPYSMINASLDSTTSYTDNTVVSGQTYYYVTTAVNSQSQESGYSNQATAVIPNP